MADPGLTLPVTQRVGPGAAVQNPSVLFSPLFEPTPYPNNLHAAYPVPFSFHVKSNVLRTLQWLPIKQNQV